MPRPGKQCYDNGIVNGATGAVISGCRLTTPARTGAGVYTLTLVDGLPQSECQVSATLQGGSAGEISVTHTSDTVKTIEVFDSAGVAADQSFSFEINRSIT